jgi:hypothetical protein
VNTETIFTALAAVSVSYGVVLIFQWVMDATGINMEDGE